MSMTVVAGGRPEPVDTSIRGYGTAKAISITELNLRFLCLFSSYQQIRMALDERQEALCRRQPVQRKEKRSPPRYPQGKWYGVRRRGEERREMRLRERVGGDMKAQEPPRWDVSDYL